MVKGARQRVLAAEKSEMPVFIKPQLATLKSMAPKGKQWLHEIKFDGYRVQVHLSRGKKKVYTRNGLDWTKRFSLIVGATRNGPDFFAIGLLTARRQHT